MAVSKKLRFEVFRRDNFACRYCGATAKDGAFLEPDHVVPRARGGKDVATNLVTACDSCNSGKSDTPLSARPIEDVPQELFRRACADRGVAGVHIEELAGDEEPIDVTEEILNYLTGERLEHLLQSAREWLEDLDEQDPAPERIRDQAAVSAYFEASMRVHALTSTLQRFVDLQPLQDVQPLWPAARAHVQEQRGLEDPPHCLVTIEVARRLLDAEDGRLMDGLPKEELDEWLQFADALDGDRSWGLTDSERKRSAAQIYRVIASDHYYPAMCSFSGQHIPTCPRRAEHLIHLNDCGTHWDGDSCAAAGGHVACSRHVEGIREGCLSRKSDGVVVSLRRVDSLATEQKESA